MSRSRSGWRGLRTPTPPPLSRHHAFRQGKQVVVPFAVRMGTDILAVFEAVHHGDIGPRSTHQGVERIGPRFDRGDDLLPRPLPSWPPKWVIPVMGVLARLLVTQRTRTSLTSGNSFGWPGRGRFSGRNQTITKPPIPSTIRGCLYCCHCLAWEDTPVDVWLIDVSAPRVQCRRMAGVARQSESTRRSARASARAGRPRADPA